LRTSTSTLGGLALLLVPLTMANAAGALESKPSDSKREVVDRIAAVIDNEIITERELDAKVRPYLAQLDDIKDPAKREERRRQLYRQVLDIEIGDKLVSRELERNKDKLGVTEQDVDRAVEEVLKMNHLTRDELQTALYGQGLTWTEYRKKLRDQIERARLIQFKVQGKIQIKDAEVKRRCEERARAGTGTAQVCTSRILLALPPDASNELVEKRRMEASRLQAELAHGADFAAYALKYSDDKNAPDGKLGCFAKGEMLKAVEDAVFNLKAGQVSGVIRTSDGFQIVKVNERVAAASTSCDTPEALNNAHNELYQEEMERQMNAWIAELRSKAFVEVHP
jgi:peptidyl-prolyl cis-trans isomerase SurA